MPTQAEFAASLNWFRHAAPYINAHRDKTVVLMFGGEALLHPNFQHIVHDIALLNALGMRLVLVHGARPQINQQLAAMGQQTPFHLNHRITTRDSLPCVLQAVGAIRLQIEALLSMGLANSPMYGARIDVVSGNFVTAKPFGIRDGVDFQLTGEVRAIDQSAIQKQLDTNSIVLLGPTGYSSTGEVYNLLAEEVATKTAIALKADKLIFLGQAQGLLDATGQLVRELMPSQLQQLLSQTQSAASAQHEQALHLQQALDACLSGVQRVHLISYARDGALIEELFTRDGGGTLITAQHYEDVRMATSQDLAGLMALLRPLEQDGILVYRSRERLEQDIAQFAVIERDGMILACAALHPLATNDSEVPSAEIACVAVDASYRKLHRGSQILRFLQQRAKQQGIQQLFVLTTRTTHWFLEQGFNVVDVSALPQSRQAAYNHQRNSQVLCKRI